MNHQPFKPPARMWGWAIHSIIAALLIVNGAVLIHNVQNDDFSRSARIVQAIAFAFMMAALYVLLGYYYLRWAAPRKTELLHISNQNRNALYEKYGRIFIDEEICLKYGTDPSKFRRLRQIDLREVNQKKFEAQNQ